MSASPFKRTLANALTVFRFFAAATVLLPLFYPFQYGELLALTAFLVGAASDYWDGRLARESGGSSAFGRIMDPLADKALTLAALAGLASRGVVGWWLFGCIAARDAVVTWVRSRMNASSDQTGARGSGKWKTAFQMSFIVACLLILTFWKEGLELKSVSLGLTGAAVLIALLTFWSGMRFVLGARAQKSSA